MEQKILVIYNYNIYIGVEGVWKKRKVGKRENGTNVKIETVRKIPVLTKIPDGKWRYLLVTGREEESEEVGEEESAWLKYGSNFKPCLAPLLPDPVALSNEDVRSFMSNFMDFIGKVSTLLELEISREEKKEVKKFINANYENWKNYLNGLTREQMEELQIYLKEIRKKA